MKYITFGKPSLYPNQIKEVKKVLKSGWLGTGPKSFEFEKKFSNFLNTKYSLSLSSCTAALFLSLKYLKIGRGDEVITTPMTFCSTINSILHVGAKPVLVDINQKTLNINEKEIEKNITKRTKAIIVVHFAGKMANIKPIIKICKKHNILVIEDCAHAIETKLNDKHARTFGDFGCYSFYVTKNITTGGEGGMIIGKNKKSIDHIRKLSLHGMSKEAWKRYGSNKYKNYNIVESGYKFNMTDIQASIGLIQLKNIQRALKKRQKIWKTYIQSFKNLPIQLPPEINKNEVNACHLFTIVLRNNREKFLNYLHKNNIGAGIHYNSISSYSFYKDKVKNFNKMKISNYVGKRIVSIPIYESLTKYEIKYIIKKIVKYFDQNSF